MNKKRILIIIACVLGLLFGSFYIYVSSYYHADINETVLTSTNDLTVIQNEDSIVYVPEDVKAGYIFYPGAKVEYTSYAPLMKSLSEEGILVVLLEMPFNIAFFNMNGAASYLTQYDDVENWYIGGHSLGGVVACSYAYKHQDDFKGMILLASYPTKDFSDTSLSLLSIRGSNDQVLSTKSYKSAKTKWPKNSKEVVIEGGNHAFYGNYGNQKKDGKATITRESQQSQTVDAITNFINEDLQ